jgi:hypothetical protein
MNISWESFKVLVGMLAVASGCQQMNESNGAIFSKEETGRPFNPLAGANFTSTHPDKPIAQASVFLDAYSESAPFTAMNCPAPMVESQIGNNSVCTAYNVNASYFSELSQKIETSVSSSLLVFKTGYGYGSYQSSVDCPVTPFNNGSAIFAAMRSIGQESTHLRH